MVQLSFIDNKEYSTVAFNSQYIKSKCTSLYLNVVCTCLYNCTAGTERVEKKVSYYILLKYIQSTNSNLLSDL